MTFKLLEMSTLIEMDFSPEESGSELLIIHAEQDVLELERSIYVRSDKYYLTFSPGKVFQRMTFLSPCSPKLFQIWSHCFPRHQFPTYSKIAYSSKKKYPSAAANLLPPNCISCFRALLFNFSKD